MATVPTEQYEMAMKKLAKANDEKEKLANEAASLKRKLNQTDDDKEKS